MTRRRAPRQSERSDGYGRLIDPTPTRSLETTRDAYGAKAQTAWEREQREQQKTS